MKQRVIYLAFMVLAFTGLANAQKYGNNWVFGINAGIDFNDVNDPTPFKTATVNEEMNACISDKEGNLLMYVSSELPSYYANDYATIYDRNGMIIEEGDSLKSSFTITNGIVILPNPSNNSLYYIFHISAEFGGNQFYYSIVKHEDNVLRVIQKNIPLSPTHRIEEKIAAVKHANGKDWWIYTGQLANQIIGPSCNNLYIYYLLNENGVNGPYYQNSGTLKCDNMIYSSAGEMIFSKNGNKLANFINFKVQTLDIDRCSGLLFNPNVFSPNNSLRPYGLEFSPNEELLYISYLATTAVDSSILIQYNLGNQTFYELMRVSDAYIQAFQLQLGIDNKIYVVVTDNLDTIIGIRWFYITTTKHLSVINNPDSMGNVSDFQSFSYYLGDSSKVSLGLPNMPNYNLGALSIYEADAGNDTCVASAQTITIGNPVIAGVQYHWHNLQPANISQHTVTVYEDTFFVVTLSDSTIINVCKTREDTIYVKVGNCNVGVAEQKAVDKIKIYPNPVTEEIKITLQNTKHKIESVAMYDVTGRAMHGSTLLTITNATVDVRHLPNGLYFLHIALTNGQRVVRKVVKE